ncbi:hypothetical protein H100_07842, partial [Trichophyton rubrum MR850]
PAGGETDSSTKVDSGRLTHQKAKQTAITHDPFDPPSPLAITGPFSLAGHSSCSSSPSSSVSHAISGGKVVRSWGISQREGCVYGERWVLLLLPTHYCIILNAS